MPQQYVIAKRTRKDDMSSSITITDRFACSAVSVSYVVGLSEPYPVEDAAITGVFHESRYARASAVVKKDASCSSLTVSFQLPRRSSSVLSGRTSEWARGSS